MWVVLKLFLVFFWAIGDAEAIEKEWESVREAVKEKNGDTLLEMPMAVGVCAVDIMENFEAAYDRGYPFEFTEDNAARARVLHEAYLLMSDALGPFKKYQDAFTLEEVLEYSKPAEAHTPSDLGGKYFGGTLKDVDFLEDDRLFWTFHYELELGGNMMCEVTLRHPTKRNPVQHYGTEICVITDGRVRRRWWRAGCELNHEYFWSKFKHLPLIAAKRLKRKNQKRDHAKKFSCASNSEQELEIQSIDAVVSLIESIHRFYEKYSLELSKKFAKKFHRENSITSLTTVLMGLWGVIVVFGGVIKAFGI